MKKTKFLTKTIGLALALTTIGMGSAYAGSYSAILPTDGLVHTYNESVTTNSIANVISHPSRFNPWVSIGAEEGSTVNINGNVTTDMPPTLWNNTGSGVGIYAGSLNGLPTTVNISGGTLNVTVRKTTQADAGSYGVHVAKNGNVNITSSSATFNVTGTAPIQNTGIQNLGNFTATAPLTFNLNNSDNTVGIQNYEGASFTANGKVTFNQVSTNGAYNTYGIENAEDSVATFNNDLEININTPGAIGGVKFDKGTVSLNGATNTFNLISTSSKTNYTFYSETAGGLVNSGNGSKLILNTTTNGTGSIAYLGNGAKINLNTNNTLTGTVQGASIRGIYIANSGGEFTMGSGANVDLNLNATNGTIYALRSSSPTGLIDIQGNVKLNLIGGNNNNSLAWAYNGGKLNVTGNFIAIGNAPNAIIAQDTNGSASTVTINRDGIPSTVQITGNLRTNGNGDDSISISFDTADSYLIGASYLGNGANAANNLTFANGSIWKMTKDSATTDLVLDNSTINMNYSGTGTYETLRTQNLNGTTGHIMMSTDLQSSHDTMNVQADSDRIKIVDGSSGNYTIDIADVSGVTGMPAEGYLLLIEDCYYPGKDYSSMATFSGGNLRKGGIFKYRPIITPEDPDALSGYTGVTTDVRPAGCGASAPPCANTSHLWTKTSWYLTASEKTDELTESVKPVLGSNAARYLNYWRELDTLLQRLGELRDNGDKQGVWVRYRHGNNNIDAIGVNSENYNMLQVGYDNQITNNEGSQRFLGLAVNHSWGDQQYVENATGSSGSTAFSLYDTWYGKKGHYLDLVAKAGRMYKNFEYTGDDYLNMDESGDSSNWFYTLSAEYGRKAYIGNDGWYVEPQAQLTFGKINQSVFTTEQGTEVTNSRVYSLVGRAGFTLGKNNKEKDSPYNIYGKLFWNKEFRGGLDSHLADIYGDTYDLHEDYSGSWLTAGLGTTVQIGKRNDFYFDVERTFGGKIETKYQWNAGFRFNW